MHQLLKNPDPPKVDESLLGSMIEYLYEFGLYDESDEGVYKYFCWCSGIVERVCYGTSINLGKMSQCYKEGEAVEVFWGAVPEFNMEASRSIETFNSRLWN